ncbi:MAG: excinuclease ABC subunit UvrB [Candidatus Wallbacteria bacterium]|nr:excinuclease ABC subunit UvrB [Candidatus Wallbacteria bacterium]
MPFKLVSPFSPSGDQPAAIKRLQAGFSSGAGFQTLLGVTGSGKTFSMANLIERLQKPTLIISHNKTLAAQLYREFKEFFPENAVEYFVSYYDYYQPEAYVVTKDLYIEKDSDINEKIDRMRHRATHSLLSRTDVIIVASVSCIYGLGSPVNYSDLKIGLKTGDVIKRGELLEKLVSINFTRNEYEFIPGTFRVRGERVELIPIYSDEGLRITFFDDEIEEIALFEPLTGKVLQKIPEIHVYPATHYAADKKILELAADRIESELKQRIDFFQSSQKLLEAQRISERTRYDLELMREMGYCKGVENYSRHLDGRGPGEPPYTLIDYFPKDFLLIIDESHITVPQLKGMQHGDSARKASLVDYGFRLPSAIDNRPLKFEELSKKFHQVLFVSATPTEFELQLSGKNVIEQIIRPTGLVDPVIEVRKTELQIDDIQVELKRCIDRKERALVTTLTKRMSEDLTAYLVNAGFKTRYLHSEIDTIERMEIIRGLRLGEFDVLVGINLLREGLDLPEVSLVVILDADKEGFLRSARSLIQTFGRCARNLNAKVLLYADRISDAMKEAMQVTTRRRQIQVEYNETHGITPVSIRKSIGEGLAPKEEIAKNVIKYVDSYSLEEVIEKLKLEMEKAANNLQFEKAAELRDEIFMLQKELKPQ